MQPAARSITSENASREEAAQQHSSAHTARLAVGVSRLSALLQVCFLLAVLTFSWPASPAAAQAPDGQTPGEMASPQAAVWTSYPIFGGNMTSMASDPNNGQVFYVGTEFAGVFKTTDAGASWQPARSGLPPRARIISLRVAPQNSAIVYAGTDASGILWKSLDAGVTWSNVTSNMPYGTYGAPADEAYNILVDPHNSDVVYLGLGGSEGQIYKTTDGGTTWWAMDNGIPRDDGNYTEEILALAIDPDQPSVLYAGGLSFGVYKTTDGGATWTALNEGVPMYRNEYKPVTALAVDPLHSNRPVGVIDGRYFTYGTDNTWSPVGTSTSVFSSYDHVHLYLHPTDPNILYGVDSGIHKTTNGGVTWVLISQTTGPYPDMAFHRSAPNTLLAANQRGWGGNTGGVRKSLNGGANWITASLGITAQPIQGLAFDPQNPNNVYAGQSEWMESGVWRSADRGLTWQFAVTDGELMDIAVDPRDSTRIYVAASDLLVSSDQGASFLTVLDGFQIATCLATTPGASNPVYAGGRDGVYKSSDSGLTWVPKNSGIPTTSGGDVAHIMSLAVDPNNPSILWAGADDEGLVKSTNAGESWQVKGFVDVPDVDAIAVKPGNSNTILVGTGDYRGSGGGTGEIHKSIDGGQTWQLKYRGTSTITDFVYDPRNSNWIYASTAYLPNTSPREGGEGVLRSFDGGEHWSSYSSGLFNPAIFSLAIGPDDPPLLLAGTKGSGLYGTLPPSWKPVFLPLVMR